MTRHHSQNTAAPSQRPLAADQRGSGALPPSARATLDIIGDAIGAFCVTVAIPGGLLFLSLIYGG